MSVPVLVFLFLSTVWGSTWLFIKLGLADLPPFTFAGIRFLIAVLPLLVILAVRRPRLPRRPADWWLMIWTGILTFTVAYGLVFWGEQHVSSGLTSILYTTMPLFGLVLAHFFVQGEPMTFRKLGGVLLGIVGVGGAGVYHRISYRGDGGGSASRAARGVAPQLRARLARRRRLLVPSSWGVAAATPSTSTGVWLAGSAGSSETPLDSEMPPPSSVPSRKVRRVRVRHSARAEGRRGWVLQSRTADSLGGVPSRSSWGWANRTPPGSLVGAQCAGQALRVRVEPHFRGSFPECADRPAGSRSAVG